MSENDWAKSPGAVLSELAGEVETMREQGWVGSKAPVANPIGGLVEYTVDGKVYRRHADGTVTGPHAEAAMGRAWSMNRVLSCLRHGGAASIRDALVAEGAPEDGAVGAAEASSRPAQDEIEYDAGPGCVLFTSHLRDMADALNRATVYTPERYPGGKPCGEPRPSVGVTCALPFGHPGTHLSLLQDGTWLHFVGQDAPHAHHAGAAGVFAADPCGEPYTGDVGPKCWGRCGKARGHGGQHRVEAKRDGGRSVWEWGPDGESFEDGAFESVLREVERQAQRERGWVGSKPLTASPVAGMVEHRRPGPNLAEALFGDVPRATPEALAAFAPPPWPAWLADLRAPAPPLDHYLEARVLGVVRGYAEAMKADAKIERDPDLGPDEHARYGLFVGERFIVGQNTPEKFERRVLLWASCEVDRLRRTAGKNEALAAALEAGVAEAEAPGRNDFLALVRLAVAETKPAWCTVFTQALDDGRVYVAVAEERDGKEYALADTLEPENLFRVRIALGDLYAMFQRCREAREAKAPGVVS
jgi:hypothetical protein